MESHSSGYYLIDPDFNIVHVNDTARNIYPNLKIGAKCYNCLMGLDSPCPPCPVVNNVKGPRTYMDPIRNIRESVDAVEVPVEGRGLCHALVFSTVGENAEFAATLPNSSEELKTLALIKALTVDYLDVFSVNLDNSYITLYRHNGKAVPANSVYSQKLLYSDGIEHYISAYVHPDDRELMRTQSSVAYLTEELKKNESIIIHYRIIHNDELHYYSRKIVRIGDANTFDNFVVGVFCEDDSVLAHQKINLLEKNLNVVVYDSLTGLYTKEAFLMNSEDILRSNSHKDYDLCILKIENIGLISHQYGNYMVEKILRLIGNLLKEYRQPDNCIAYMGNGTFTSITVNTSEAERKNNIMKFRKDILDNCGINNISLKWSIYKAIRRDEPITAVYENTMYALSTIRSSIHDDYVEFDDSMMEKMRHDVQLEREFESALKNREFKAWYQPKYSARTQQIIGAEALVRWLKPDGTLISPAEFIPIIEQNGKISKLDAHIFELVCQFQKKLESLGYTDLPISVNLSRASMFTEDIANAYQDNARKHEVNPSLIPIEITESAAVRATTIKEFAHAFIEKGFRFHMDDFGAGYSSLASLQVIPFESIKIDKSLIDFIGNEDSDILLKHVISFAHETGKSVIAEGVESYEQYYFLKVIGCDYIQGYYFSKPLSEEDFLWLLQSK